MNKESALQALKWELEHTKSSTLKDAILALHPELAESEDERIRKVLLRCCDDWEKGQFGCMAKEDVPAIRAYLEKQKEQESLSTEETELNSIAFLEQIGYTCIPPGKEQPAEWSEEDEKMRKLCEDFVSEFHSIEAMQVKSWLKSLRLRSHWKPSEEQISALERAIVKMHTSNDIGDRKSVV